MQHSNCKLIFNYTYGHANITILNKTHICQYNKISQIYFQQFMKRKLKQLWPTVPSISQSEQLQITEHIRHKALETRSWLLSAKCKTQDYTKFLNS